MEMEVEVDAEMVGWWRRGGGRPAAPHMPLVFSLVIIVFLLRLRSQKPGRGGRLAGPVDTALAMPFPLGRVSAGPLLSPRPRFGHLGLDQH